VGLEASSSSPGRVLQRVSLLDALPSLAFPEKRDDRNDLIESFTLFAL
jgi:hypothetical protein